MNNLLAKIKLARVIGQQQFGTDEFLIVTDFSNGLVQPSQNADLWDDYKYTYMSSVVSDAELMEHVYVEYTWYLQNEKRCD